MNKTTIQLSEYTQDRLKQIARRKGLSLSQLINEISLRYIGAEESARMMAERAARGSKVKALRAMEALREAGRPPLPEDPPPDARERHEGPPREAPHTRRSLRRPRRRPA
jgi:hypothetical protein